MKPQLELRHFAALVALADTGSVGKAAQRIGVAQSTFSESLLSLERVLGRAVLERAPGTRARLSAAAQRLLPHARSILQATERAFADATALPARLVVGTVESISSYVLPAVLETLRAAHPALEVQVVVGLCEALRQQFARGQIDLLLTLEHARDQTPGAEPAVDAQAAATLRCRVPLVLLRGAGGALAEHTAMRRDGTLLAPDADGALHAAIRAWLERLGESPRLISAGTIDGVRKGLAAPATVGILPLYTVSDDLADGRLQQLTPPAPLPMLELRTRTSGDVHPAAHEVSAAVIGLLESHAAATSNGVRPPST